MIALGAPRIALVLIVTLLAICAERVDEVSLPARRRMQNDVARRQVTGWTSVIDQKDVSYFAEVTVAGVVYELLIDTGRYISYKRIWYFSDTYFQLRFMDIRTIKYRHEWNSNLWCYC